MFKALNVESGNSDNPKVETPFMQNTGQIEPDSLYKKECETENDLLDRLLILEANKKKLQKNYRFLLKETKKMEKSRLLRFASFYWKFIGLSKKVLQWVPFYRKIRILNEENNTLVLENIIFQKQLVEYREHKANVEWLKEELTNLSHQENVEMNKMMKNAKENGHFIKYMDTLIHSKEIVDQKYSSTLKNAGRLYQQEQDTLQSHVYSKVLAALPLNEVPEFIVRRGENNHEFSLHHLASFRAVLSLQARKRQLTEAMPEWILDNKVNAYTFIDRLGVRRPWVSETVYCCEEIPYEDGIVIKPVNGAGSRGVYLVFDTDYIQDVRRGDVFHDWDMLSLRMKKDLDNDWVSQDEWMIEELISENRLDRKAPRDLKFYCFYGEIALVLEVVRYPELKYCWWKADGTMIHTGKYEDDLFVGNGFRAEDLKLAQQISLEIPAPFIRIDFLKTETEMIFGEFTPKPGNYDEFDNEIDQILGDCFLQAENRLIHDMINGKNFDHYHHIIQPTKVYA